MWLPQANLVLFFLSAFVALWGVSVIVRGLRAGLIPGSRRCPECSEDMRGIAGRRCPACEFEAADEAGLQQVYRDFRIVIVGVGALTAGVALVPVAMWVREWETTGDSRDFGMHPLHAVFWGVAAFGVVLAMLAVRGDRSKGRRRCPKCWYDMSATLRGSGENVVAGLTCPECGHEPASDRAFYSTRRRPQLVLLGTVLVAIGLYGQTVPRALRLGPVGLVPTTVLIGGMRWLPESWFVDPNGVSEATLMERVRGGEVWEWQRLWSSWSVRSMVRDDILAVSPSITGAAVDWESGEDRSFVALGFAKLLGDPNQVLTAQQYDELSDSLRYAIYNWREYGDEELNKQVQDAVSANMETLLRRVRTGTDTESVLCLRLLGFGYDLPEDWIPTLSACIRKGGPETRKQAGKFLGKAARTDERAMQEIRLLLGDTEVQRRLVLGTLRVAIHGPRYRDEVESALIEMIRTATDGGTVSGAAYILAEVHSESAAFAALVADSELHDSARKGFAEAWTRGGQVVAGEVSAVLLPGLQSDDSDVVHTVLWFFKYRSRDTTMPAGDVMDAVIPLLGHSDELIRSTAVEVLVALRWNHTGLDERIDAALGAAGLDEHGEPLPGE